MTLLSTAAQNASLDNDYGSSAGSNAPSSLEFALYNGDPLLGGTELGSDGGYAAVTADNDGTTWPDAASGGAKTSKSLALATSTAAFSDTATHFVIRDASSGDLWDSGLLTEEVSVDAAGVDVSFICTVYYEEGL